ncbi:unnamed protein product (macronuclear) [Paramecium tetraurelia]|uniref:Transmembrane protein n=1 Tax=Paramecium tetraurelia TaxID=5888 RepID=A0CJ66_PARTE|nr:uncharacterized protein GSPATT00038615001 [Paramecium tetraurelia]CAK70833.1 unnamed protein product [Paramecium tetraurelia]|eukprot:XP_001438230.1 hypothetical protein (macronuclear) [Paramecium tetraurelia strain d4-2]
MFELMMYISQLTLIKIFEQTLINFVIFYLNLRMLPFKIFNSKSNQYFCSKITEFYLINEINFIHILFSDTKKKKLVFHLISKNFKLNNNAKDIIKQILQRFESVIRVLLLKRIFLEFIN